MKTSTTAGPLRRPTLGVVIRFKNSESTLPEVLAAIRKQTLQPDLVVGVDNASTDSSARIMEDSGGRVIRWDEQYHHSRVLNFGFQHCPTELVIVLSSHTVLQSENAFEKLVDAMADPNTSCASGKWDADPFYSDCVDWLELRSKGLKFCSIYSNSMGVVRRRLWEETPFDESLPTMEDGAWAIEQLRRGRNCRRVEINYAYNRRGGSRRFAFACVTFLLAKRNRLKVAWLGARGTLKQLLAAPFSFNKPVPQPTPTKRLQLVDPLLAWFAWRLYNKRS